MRGEWKWGESQEEPEFFCNVFISLKKDKVNIPKYQQHPNQSGRNTGVYYI